MKCVRASYGMSIRYNFVTMFAHKMPKCMFRSIFFYICFFFYFASISLYVLIFLDIHEPRPNLIAHATKHANFNYFTRTSTNWGTTHIEMENNMKSQDIILHLLHVIDLCTFRTSLFFSCLLSNWENFHTNTPSML